MRHAPDPIRGLLHILGLTLTFVGIALLSAKKGHGFFIFYILRTIYDVDHFAPRTNGLTDTHALETRRFAGLETEKTPVSKGVPMRWIFHVPAALSPEAVGAD